jgi:hypothetical protein
MKENISNNENRKLSGTMSQRLVIFQSLVEADGSGGDVPISIL